MGIPLQFTQAVCIVYFGLTFVQSYNQTEDQFQNLFSSLLKNNNPRMKSIISFKTLKNKLVKEQKIFNAINEELQTAKHVHTYKKKNFFEYSKTNEYVELSKREANKQDYISTSTMINTVQVQETDKSVSDADQVVNRTTSLKHRFSLLTKAIDTYHNFIKNLKEAIEDESSESSADYDSQYYESEMHKARPEDQEQEYKKKNYDFMKGIMYWLQEIQIEHFDIDTDYDTQILENITTMEQVDHLRHVVQKLQKIVASYESFMDNLSGALVRNQDVAKEGKQIQVWCSEGTCEHGGRKYQFTDEDHINWLKETINKIKELDENIRTLLMIHSNADREEFYKKYMSTNKLI